jgi:hypothetical protein
MIADPEPSSTLAAEAPSRSAPSVVISQRRVTSHWPLLRLAFVVLFISSAGAQCPQVVQQYTHPLPRVLPPSATLEQVMAAVNENSAKVQTYHAARASLGTPGFPSLRANIAFERPRNFRLRAETGFTGPEVDLGSNSDLFWLWIRRNQPPTTFVCRHDQFVNSTARQVMPIEPEWLIQALGVVSFDPADQHQGPFPAGGGRLQIRSAKPVGAVGGPLPSTKVTVVDDSRGYVVEQHVYDPQNVLLASAVMSRHSRDQATGVTLPRAITIKWPPAKFELNVDITDVQINTQLGNPQELFAKPQFPGYTELDLANPDVRPVAVGQ